MSDNRNHGLSTGLINDILAIFSLFPQITWVKIYGSRAKGNYRPNSDIDLAFSVSDGSDPSSKIWGELDELSCPYHFDVTHYDRLENIELKNHIDRVGLEIKGK